MALALGAIVIGVIIIAYIVDRVLNRVKKPKENCSKCGTKLTPEDKFCPSCGEKV